MTQGNDVITKGRGETLGSWAWHGRSQGDQLDLAFFLLSLGT